MSGALPPTAIAVAAGGTGGHLFPAQALASALSARGHTVHLLTDDRGAGYVDRFPGGHVHVVPSETLRGKSVAALFKMGAAILSGVWTARGILARENIAAVIAFGGYPSLPPGYAAWSRGKPLILHEQNAVMGRANRLMAWPARKIATCFPELRNLSARENAKCVMTGNPVRQAVLDAADTPFPAADERFRLLVFGGSQGAHAFAVAVPPALATLDEPARARLKVVQQCREEDLDDVRSIYEAAGIDAELAPFFADLPQRIAGAHLVIARAGASSVAELAAIGRPAVLVPYPYALDNDQLENARVLEAAGGALVIEERDLSIETLAAGIADAMADTDGLATMAHKMKAAGRPDAADALADLVEAELGGA